MKIEKKLQNFIGGEYVKSSSKELIDIYFPATNEKISEVEIAGEEELDLAVKKAQAAQKEWANKPPAEKSGILKKAAEIAKSKNEELAWLEVMDTGKPLQEANCVDIFSGAEALEYYGSAAALVKGEYYQLGDNHAHVRREPLGVVAGIGAWNYPFQIACWKSAPALAAGNAMIFKPSEETTMTALKLAEIYKEAGLPDGLFNVLLGDARLGKMIVEHPGIKKISLTGEAQTGKKVMAAAASRLKHVTLELGGKSPLIVFEDANIPNAVQAAMLANFYTQGEICSNGTRVFVQESIKEDFLKELDAKTKKLVVGDPLQMETQVGALINSSHAKKVRSFIQKGLEEGAVLFCQKEPDNLPAELAKENFVGPVVFDQCQDHMAVAKEEIFGPVMCVFSFKDEQEVVERANNTIYGLASGLFTNDLNRANRVSAALEAGICWVNTYNITPLEIPFGGYKESGLGRENSVEGLLAYTQMKTVYFETGDVDSPYK